MRHQDLPLEVRDRLREIWQNHKKGRKVIVPQPGDCFFLEAPTPRPELEPDHALTAAFSKKGDALLCAKISLEYWEASEYDYMMDADEWTAEYPAIVEVWNTIVFIPRHPLLIHATIPPESLELIKKLFLWHQQGQAPPADFKGIGKPMPDDPDHPMWAFRAREAQVMERVRRHYHEGWDVKLVQLPVRRAGRGEEARMAAATDDLASHIEKELEAQKKDKEILGPPRLPDGQLFLRRDSQLPGYKLLWYSQKAAPPPDVTADPPLERYETVPEQGLQIVIGFWKDEALGKEILLDVHTEHSPTQVLVRIPRRKT